MEKRALIGKPVATLVLITTIVVVALASWGMKLNKDKQPLSQATAEPAKISPTEALKKFKVAIRTGDVGEANRQFKNIPSGTIEHKEAMQLYDERKRKKAREDKEAAVLAKKLSRAQRQQFAKVYEQQLLDKGMDVYVTTQGKEHNTLKVKWVLVSRPLVHKMINDESVIANLRQLGFTKLVMTDGYNSSWNVDLK